VTNPGKPAAYRYVSDGTMAGALNRDAVARANLPVAGSVLGLVGFGVGFYASFDSNRASLPYHRGEVVRIALVWGLACSAIWLAAGVVALVVARAANRQRMRRLFPTGSVTEVRLEQDALVLTRPGGTRTIPYGRIRRVRAYEHTRWIVARERPIVEVLPAGLLPPDALDLIEARSRGVVPVSTPSPPTASARQVAVPENWARHVAWMTLTRNLRRPRFWVRLGLGLLVSAPIALVAGPAWLALAPAVALLSVTFGYVHTLRAMAEAAPPGSLISTEAHDDRLITRNPRWSRLIPFDHIRGIDVHGDLVFLEMTTAPPLLVMARELVPDDLIERHRASRSGSG